ncbi:hypothetical protein FGG08_002566 [Glutinoglossum americanum]|uniref:Uncharacterized protein n=1 Tax=Glutinoglossum americanum TaxID=1670608 RepID=A0A9P8I4H3_9PEZI|nr:hypothetical protein FGG08_002566 [Glutinoglossum americanum]
MASSHQTGPILQHWNDVPLDFTYSASSSRSATPAGAGTPSHPSLLPTKYNNSTLSLAVNVGSRATSRPSSAAGFRPAPSETPSERGEAAALMTAAYVADQERQMPYDEPNPPEDNQTETENQDYPSDAMTLDPPDASSFTDLLDHLLALPTTMSPVEHSQVQDRLRKYVPGITDEQKEELGWVLREVVEGRQEGATWGREMVVRFMKEWVGRGDVSRWGGGLRRVVESLEMGVQGTGGV